MLVERVSGKEMTVMVRQCAWCLRLIDDVGTPLSSRPEPKNYKATHGMCLECGVRWLADVLRNDELASPEDSYEVEASRMLNAGNRGKLVSTLIT